MLNSGPLPIDPPVEPTVLHVVYESGALGRITVGAGLEPVLADSVQVVPPSVWESMQAQMREQHEARIAELQAAEAEQRREAYEALVQVPGITEAVARSLSGHPEALDDGNTLARR
ncbi:hypothetical protein [Streptomyces eurythermus]